MVDEEVREQFTGWIVGLGTYSGYRVVMAEDSTDDRTVRRVDRTKQQMPFD